MRGKQHDAWVNGASDPLSGQVAQLEEAKAISELAKSGWRPKRTIQFAAWDGEEEGLIGSTEWAETHADELRDKGVVYINSDTNSRGFLDAEGSHTLERLVTQVARDVPDPERNVSVLARMLASEATRDARDGNAGCQEPHDGDLIRLDALGSGSDYAVPPAHQVAGWRYWLHGGEAAALSLGHDSFDHTPLRRSTFDYGIAQAKRPDACCFVWL
jgi:N-acetylated-alpha-linked acidic dipeptidase